LNIPFYPCPAPGQGVAQMFPSGSETAVKPSYHTIPVMKVLERMIEVRVRNRMIECSSDCWNCSDCRELEVEGKRGNGGVDRLWTKRLKTGIRTTLPQCNKEGVVHYALPSRDVKS